MRGVIVAGMLALPGGVAAGAEGESAAGRPVLGKNADGYLEVFRVVSSVAKEGQRRLVIVGQLGWDAAARHRGGHQR